MIKKYCIPALFLSALIYMVGLSSCSLLDPPVTIPCYGHIDTMGITTNYASQGTASSSITCAWVYVDDQPVGAFALPCKFPMIAGTGSHLITIFPGITADGITSTREKYPFYTFYNTTVNIKQDSVVTFKYVPTYTSITQFDWMEDFEANGVSIATDTSETTRGNPAIIITSVGAPYAFQGNYSGEVLLDSNSQHNYTNYVGITLDTFNLPHDGSPVFMEMNYNTNALFGVGLCYGGSTTNQLPVLVEIYPTTGWSKIYIDLGPAVANHQGSFYVYFSFQRPPGLAQAKLYLDNIKVMHNKGA